MIAIMLVLRTVFLILLIHLKFLRLLTICVPEFMDYYIKQYVFSGVYLKSVVLSFWQDFNS